MDVQSRQVLDQYQAFQGLLDVQSALPVTIEEMTLDIGGGTTLSYAELVGQRDQVAGDIAGFERNLAAIQSQIAGLSASELDGQLQSVRNSLGNQRSFLQDVESLMVTVASEIYARGGSLPDMAGSEAPEGLDTTALSALDFASFTDTELLSLYGDILAVEAGTEQQIGGLEQLESQVLYQMSSDPDTLAWVDRQLDLIDTAPAELADLEAQISALWQARETLQTIIGYGQGSAEPPVQYLGMIDADLRSLGIEGDTISPTLLPLLTDLSATQPYYDVQNDLSQVYYDTYLTDQALVQIQALAGETDYIALDDGIRFLEEYLNVLSEGMRSMVQQLSGRTNRSPCPIRSGGSTAPPQS